MAEDIVIRLRNWHTDHDSAFPRPIDLEAADEIEHLRALVEHLSAQLRLQIKANDKAWEAYKEVTGDD
jgi:hypothetical protein